MEVPRLLGWLCPMPKFQFQALSENGAVVRGEEVASSPSALRRTLSERGLLAQQIHSGHPGLKAKPPRRLDDSFLLFNQEFIALLRAGLSIPEALDLIASGRDMPYLGQVLRKVREDVRQGASLSEACAQHPEIFDGLYLAGLKTGEKSGDLVNALSHYQEYLQRRIAFRRKLSRAAAYPLFLIITLVAILAILFIFVMPRFIQMYADFDAQLPLATRMLMGLVEHMPWLAPVIIVALMAIGFSVRQWSRTAPGRLRIDAVKLRIPGLGEATEFALVAQLARTLSTLLSSGTPLVESLRVAYQTLSNRAVAARLQVVERRVVEGRGLALAMREEQIMPEIGLKLVGVGEASGSLSQMLAEIARYYEDLLDHRISRLMTIAEPALMLLMGILVGAVIIVMYLPIFHLADIIQ